jgi:hypothetical protein
VTKILVTVAGIAVIIGLLIWIGDDPCKAYRYSSITDQPAGCLKENLGL